MNMDELQKAIEMIDDELITETGNARKCEKKISKFSGYGKYASVAACFCILIIGSLIVFGLMNNSKSAPDKEYIPTDAILNEEFCTSYEDGLKHEEDEEQKTENTATHDRINNNTTTKESIYIGSSNSSAIEITPPETHTDPKDENGNIDTMDKSDEKKTVNLSAGIETGDFKNENLGSPVYYSIPFSDYAIKLFREVYTGNNNEILSPLSVSYALGMAANGANGETLKQIEDLLGMSKDEFNTFLRNYMNSLPNGEKYSFSAANSVWLRNSFCDSVANSYLKVLLNHYSAEVYTSPFDNSTVNKINGWVNNKTDGMIKEIVDDISNCEMLLINALSFDAEWEERFEAYKNSHGDFTNSDKSKVNVEYMNGILSNEHKNYIEDENATGFIKYYKDNKYAFVALLPSENISINEYVNGLTGEKLNSLIINAVNQDVKISIPKFKTTYENKIADSLINLGVEYAFDPNMADFSEMSKSTSLHISNVIHKTYFEINEVGSKAGAVTSVKIPMGLEIEKNDIKEVYLNRPFIYMVIDCENSIPMFIGTVTDPTK